MTDAGVKVKLAQTLYFYVGQFVSLPALIEVFETFISEVESSSFVGPPTRSVSLEHHENIELGSIDISYYIIILIDNFVRVMNFVKTVLPNMT